MPIFGKNSSSHPEKETSRNEVRPSYFGPKVRLRGDLGGDEEILLDGPLEGRVDISKSFRVGAAGQVLAEVNARVVTIAGHVVGNVVASERVEILPTGVLEGNIRAPKIVIADGAKFKGSVDMGERADGLAPHAPAESR
jgi:cytoskeletal protein CcmA (bactofilin family)